MGVGRGCVGARVNGGWVDMSEVWGGSVAYCGSVL